MHRTGRSHRLYRMCRPIALGLLAAVALLFARPGLASAHAHLIQANPAPGAVIARAPSTGSFLFDEPLNPTLTRVRIVDSSGRQVAGNGGYLAPVHNGELWQIPIPGLPNGTYSVYWTSESATDGHVISSFYTFSIAASGGTASAGAVTGAAAGSYGGQTGSGSGGLPIGVGPAVTAVLAWLELMAQALWLGALICDLLVLEPARRTVDTPERRLAWAATPLVWALVRGAPVAAVWALAGEVVSLALQGTGGDWARALAPDTLGGILSSQNGHFVLLRFATLLVALILTTRVSAPSIGLPADARRTVPPKSRPSAQRLGITASTFAPPRAEAIRGPLTLLAAAYMLLAAFSGHAANVSPAWLSYPIDWLHLVFTAAWVGGIATLALGVMPARQRIGAEERASAVLPLLDRFSPVAYVAIAVLALSGLYNAVNHLDAPARLADTFYGQLLDIKLALIALLIVLSYSHVRRLRPQIARAQGRGWRDMQAFAAAHDGLGTLAARLRLETGVGAAVLLATAFMTQTLPANSTTQRASTPAIPTSINGMAATGNLRGTLTVAPPAIGSTTFRLTLTEGGRPVTENNGAALLHLYPANQPSLRANLTFTAHGTRFTATGSLPSNGSFHADVLVRTVAVNDYRTLSYVFTIGPGAGFVPQGINPTSVGIAVTPGLISAGNTFTIDGVTGSAVRLLSESLDMQMGTLTYSAKSLGGGRWQVTNAYAPMNGRWGLTVQVQRDGAWSTVRQFVFQVPLSGKMRLLGVPTATSTAAPSSGAPSGPSSGAAAINVDRPFNVAFARTLPYTAFVTEMASGGVRRLGGALISTGTQAHGVDVLDGTPYAYVTNYGSGTVSQIDMRTMRVIRTFTVGLGPAHVIFLPDHSEAFVTNFLSSDLSVINLHTGVVRSIEFPNLGCFQPHGEDLSSDGHTLYVACAGDYWIQTVDTRTLRPGRQVPTALGAYGVTDDASRHEIWVTSQTENNVTVVDEKTLKVLATVPVGKGPALPVVSPDGSRVYVADQLGSALTVIDAATRRVVATIPVAPQPHGPDVTVDGRYVYVASINGNVVTIIRASDNKVVAIVPAPRGSNEVAIAH